VDQRLDVGLDPGSDEFVRYVEGALLEVARLVGKAHLFGARLEILLPEDGVDGLVGALARLGFREPRILLTFPVGEDLPEPGTILKNGVSVPVPWQVEGVVLWSFEIDLAAFELAFEVGDVAALLVGQPVADVADLDDAVLADLIEG
jgi:hypothetical protein